jgi:hypothetical protein
MSECDYTFLAIQDTRIRENHTSLNCRDASDFDFTPDAIKLTKITIEKTFKEFEERQKDIAKLHENQRKCIIGMELNFLIKITKKEKVLKDLIVEKTKLKSIYSLLGYYLLNKEEVIELLRDAKIYRKQVNKKVRQYFRKKILNHKELKQ